MGSNCPRQDLGRVMSGRKPHLLLPTNLLALIVYTVITDRSIGVGVKKG
jgi:hypothetical protein